MAWIPGHDGQGTRSRRRVFGAIRSRRGDHASGARSPRCRHSIVSIPRIRCLDPLGRSSRSPGLVATIPRFVALHAGDPSLIPGDASLHGRGIEGSYPGDRAKMSRDRCFDRRPATRSTHGIDGTGSRGREPGIGRSRDRRSVAVLRTRIVQRSIPGPPALMGAISRGSMRAVIASSRGDASCGYQRGRARRSGIDSSIPGHSSYEGAGSSLRSPVFVTTNPGL
jgi:hypothetical protein